MIPHDSCNCPYCELDRKDKQAAGRLVKLVLEARRRFEGGLVLLSSKRKNPIIVPTQEEWIGLNLNKQDEV